MADTEFQYYGKDLEALSFAPKYHQWILESVAGYLGRDIAEIGAGTGNFTRLLLHGGQRRVTAFEPSANMFPRLDALRGEFPDLTTHNSFLADRAPELRGCFDNVLYINVLEHIEDDLGELRLACEALKPDGRLVIFVPALRWLYGRLDELVGHFRRYHRQPLREVAETAGFRVVRVHYFDIAGILPWLVVFRLLRAETIPTSVGLYDNLVVPVMRRVESVLRPPIGKNLLLVAEPNR
jgi:SAM-dependent methyltransferase